MLYRITQGGQYIMIFESMEPEYPDVADEFAYSRGYRDYHDMRSRNPFDPDIRIELMEGNDLCWGLL